MRHFSPLLHSYSLLLFSQHRGFAGLLVLASFANPWAGAAGLVATGLAVATARLGGFNRELTDVGAYSFNPLLVGLALGTLYAPGAAWALTVVVGAAVAFGLSVALSGWLGSRGLPALALPFVLTMWLLGPGGAHLVALRPSEGGALWLNDLYAVGGPPLVSLATWLTDWPSWPSAFTTYLRALSGVLIQDSPTAGLLVAAGLLWHSRIAFSVSALAFLGATGFGALTGIPIGPADTYNLGANYLLTALAVGAVFLVPRPGAYALALGTIPLTAVLLGGLGAALGRLGLPVYSLPFAVGSLLVLYCLKLRDTPPSGLTLTPVQRYSPERNLYADQAAPERRAAARYFPLSLPLLGEWRCTQGYTDADAGPTHQGEWGQALDFVVTDTDGHDHHGTGTVLTDYFCFDKPVLAAADGVVEEVVSHLPDNPIGQVDTRHNWGNSVVVRHLPGLYTQVSHLRQDSVRVKPGQVVRRGEVLGACGSSGRSPAPHLHFQAQATPFVGSRTLAYPLAAFVAGSNSGPAELRRFAVPRLGETVRPPQPYRLLAQALRLPPGYVLDVRATTPNGVPAGPAQRWEVFTDAYNQHYLRCHATGAVAYFERDEATFWLTTYYGDEAASLYAFYLAAYQVPLALPPGQETTDELPLSIVRNPALRAAQDVVAPFWRFIRPVFRVRYAEAEGSSRTFTLHSRAEAVVFGRTHLLRETELLFQDGALRRITVQVPGRVPLSLLCEPATV